jgi:hypothetical protein
MDQTNADFWSDDILHHIFIHHTLSHSPSPSSLALGAQLQKAPAYFVVGAQG